MVQNCACIQALLSGATETTERVPYFDDAGLGWLFDPRIQDLPGVYSELFAEGRN